MKQFKIAIAVAFVIYFAIYLFMPYIVTSADFGADMPSEVSLGGFVWGGDQVSHIARYVQDNLRASVPLRGLTRDIFMTGVVWPVIGLVLLVLVLAAKKAGAVIAAAALLCVWGIWGGLYFFTDPVLNIGGAAYWLMTAILMLLGLAGAAYVFVQIRVIRKGVA